MSEWSWVSGLGDIGAGALVTLFVLLIFFGRLVPKSTVDRIEADLARERLARETLEKAFTELANGGIRDSNEIGRTTVAALEGIRKTAAERRETS